MNKAQFNKYVRKVLVKNIEDCKPITRDSNELEADHVINTFIDSVLLALKEEDEISLVGFGRFYKTRVNTRTGRNPKTGESITIPAHIQLRFTAGKHLKEACNTIPATKKKSK